MLCLIASLISNTVQLQNVVRIEGDNKGSILNLCFPLSLRIKMYLLTFVFYKQDSIFVSPLVSVQTGFG